MTEIALVVALMALGVALLVVEVLVIPGVGVVGALGLAAVAGSVWAAYAVAGIGAAAVLLAGSAVSTGLAFWWLPKTGAGRSLFLEAATRGRAGDPALLELLGCEGVALTPLRPAGTAEIAGRAVDVVSDSQYLAAQTPLRVLSVRGSRVVVEALEKAAGAALSP